MIVAENDICKLRYLKKEDLELLSVYANNPKIAANLRDGFPYPYTIENARFYYNMVKSAEQESNFVIEYLGEFSGMIGLNKLTDVYRKSAEIGYWLAEPFWNKGIVTKAVISMVNWGWANMDIVRIHTGVFAYNKASARVLEKAGFTFECEFKNSIYKNGNFTNELRYSLLKPS
jgi:[ribosomal protein S5]-alanine N-acetyltransferase